MLRRVTRHTVHVDARIAVIHASTALVNCTQVRSIVREGALDPSHQTFQYAVKPSCPVRRERIKETGDSSAERGRL